MAHCRPLPCCAHRPGFDPFPATSEVELDRIVADLDSRKQAWVQTSNAERARLLRQCVDTTLEVRRGAARRSAACRAGCKREGLAARVGRCHSCLQCWETGMQGEGWQLLPLLLLARRAALTSTRVCQLLRGCLPAGRHVTGVCGGGGCSHQGQGLLRLWHRRGAVRPGEGGACLLLACAPAYPAHACPRR